MVAATRCPADPYFQASLRPRGPGGTARESLNLGASLSWAMRNRLPRPEHVRIEPLWAEQLARLVARGQLEKARRLVDRYVETGASLEVALSSLLVGAEIHLERWWSQDRMSSLERTLGVCGLRTLAYHLVDRSVALPKANRRGLVLSLEEDRITLTPVLYACTMTMLGYDAVHITGKSADEVVQQVARFEPTLLLFCVDRPRLMEWTTECASRISDAVVKLGAGAAFFQNGVSLRQTGLDGLVAEPLELSTPMAFNPTQAAVGF